MWGTTYATEICGDRQHLVSYDSAECAAGSARALRSHDGTIVATHRIVRRAEASIRTVESFVASPKAISLSTSDASYGPLPMHERREHGYPQGARRIDLRRDWRTLRREIVSAEHLAPGGLAIDSAPKTGAPFEAGSYRRDRYPPGGLIDRSTPELAHS